MFSDSTVTYGVAANEDGDYELTWTGEPVAMDVLSIVPNATGEGAYTPGVNFDNEEIDYIVRYLTDSNYDGVLDNGDKIINPSTEAPTAIGNYFIVSLTKTALAKWGAANPDYDDAEGLLDAEGNVIDGVIAQYFKVVPRSLEGTVAVNVETGAGAFTYDGKDQVPALGFEDGSGRDLDADDYSVTYTDAAGKTVTEIVNAGAYTAHLTGKGGYQNSTADVAFTVGQLDLTGAVVYAKDYADDTVANLAQNVWVDGVNLYDVWGDVARAQVRYHATDGTVYSASETDFFKTMAGDAANAAGGYDFTLTGVKNANGSENVVGSVSYTHGVFKDVIDDGSITYDGVQLSKQSDPDGGLNGAILDLSVNPYDTSEIAVAGHDAEDYSVSLSTEDAAAPGTYTTIVRMSNEPANYSLGGSDFATFSVVKGEIDTASVDVVALIDGKNVEFGNAFPHTYDALPVIPVITVKHGDATLVEGEDYTVSYTNAAGDPVEEMLEAGVYTVTISSDEYRIVGDASFDVRINPRPFADTYGTDGSLVHKAVDYVKTAVSAEGTAGLAYTGDALEPQFQGHYLNPIDNECVYVDMDPSWYLVSGLKYQAPGSERWVPAEEILEVGTYVLNLTPQPACANYTWAADYDVYVEVVDTAWFTDVATTEWYAEEVNKAAQLGYVQGLGDRLFFPDADMTRAQFAQVLFNMSGAIEEGGSHPTQFTDVESTAWYAEAVSWAVEAGVVNGVSDTQFDPEGKITREQIATMLYRYAGNNAQADASALNTFVDGAQVSDWAANAMAWAVEEGHMNGKGNNDLQPQATATRAEVAALAVRVQPEAL